MTERTGCLVIGGGPAGMMLGLTLARAGVEVTVLEKHGDFLIDFRGDTVHPTTLQLLDELGLGERFAKLPSNTLHEVAFPIEGNRRVVMADLRRLKVSHPYIKLIPQQDLLDLLAKAGRAEPTYTLRMNTEATQLIHESGRVAGVRYRTKDAATGEIRADLTVACDGRVSITHQQTDLPLKELPIPLDAWWFLLPHKDGDDPPTVLSPYTGRGKFVIIIPRSDYHQVGYIGKKGTDAAVRARGIEAIRKDVAETVPWLADRVDTLTSMDEVRFLDYKTNRLKRWHTDGLLCIGDAAHAMSPMGGVGINLAIQDAVAAATLLAEPLLRGRPTPAELAKVRARRKLPVVFIQTFQRLLHRFCVAILEGRRSGPPKIFLVMSRVPAAQKVAARFIGVGFRPEHAPEFARRPQLDRQGTTG